MVGSRMGDDERNLMQRANALILESVDETLENLGGAVKEVVYDSLERDCFIARCEIPLKLDEVFVALEGKFGKTVEKIIAGELEFNLRVKSAESSNAEYRDYLEVARRKLDQSTIKNNSSYRSKQTLNPSPEPQP